MLMFMVKIMDTDMDTDTNTPPRTWTDTDPLKAHLHEILVLWFNACIKPMQGEKAFEPDFDFIPECDSCWLSWRQVSFRIGSVLVQ